MTAKTKEDVLSTVTWDHGKSVEARALPSGEKVRRERVSGASDGSLKRFT